ncbi:MAG: hypothetical protein K0R55_99 [Sporomusa sp.]|jgi:type II secretory pathway pseudopilin PulG|nr:hypothetical protein [Sporomusa sp.]
MKKIVMKCYWADQQGLTLVELMAGLSVFIILMSAIFPLLSTSIKAWQIGRSRVDIQQTARLAVERVAHSVRYAKNVTVGDSGGSLILIDGDSSSVKYSVSPETKALCITLGNGTPQPLAGDGYNKIEGQVIIIPNPNGQQRFSVQDVYIQDKNGNTISIVKQVKMIITVRDKKTSIEYTLPASIVALNS